MSADVLHSNHIVIFNDQTIRCTFHNDEWWFVVVDVIQALTDSKDPSNYLKNMRRRDPELVKGGGQIDTPLSFNTVGGKQKLNCANTEGIFRIIQSIPSPKAEPFKRWLAQVGYERVKEIEDPELASQRARAIYKAKGYSDTWIEKRMRGIQIRDELTDEWKNRGVNESKDFGILTAEICKATFGVTPTDYKELKALNKENLRDHMTDLELIFTMLGEASTTAIARTQDAQGFNEIDILHRHKWRGFPMNVSVGSCFIDVAQGCTCWLGFRRNLFPVGTFTVLHQLMFPRSQHISTSVTSDSPKTHIGQILNGNIVSYISCPAVVRLVILILTSLKYGYNRFFIAIFAMTATMSALYPRHECRGLTAH